MNDDNSIYERQSEIQNLFNEAQLQGNSDHVLDENGMDEWVNGYENQPRHFAIGNYAHENAEQFTDIPPNLDSERTVSTDNGTVRVDRMDWDGNIYEVKPQTESSATQSAYQNQVDKQVEIFSQAYPEYDTPTGHVVTYDRQEVEQQMIDKGLLSPLPEAQVNDSNSNPNPDSNINNSPETTFNLENQGEQATMQTFDDKNQKIEQDGLSTPASPTDPNDNDSDNVTNQIEGEPDLGDAVREGIIDIDAEREQNQPQVENPFDNLDKLPEEVPESTPTEEISIDKTPEEVPESTPIEEIPIDKTPEEVPEYTPIEEIPIDNNPEEVPDYIPQEDINSSYSESNDLNNTVSNYDWDNQTEDYVENTVSDYDWDNQTQDYVESTVSDYDDGFETSYDNSYDTSYEIGINESCNNGSSFESDF